VHEARQHRVLYYTRLLDWKHQTLTPNPDVIYLIAFFKTKDVVRWCWRFRLAADACSTEAS
jgi:hypothetical protein